MAILSEGGPWIVRVFLRHTTIAIVFLVVGVGNVRPDPVHKSTDGLYAFPIAGDVATMRWTRYHWDGSDAVDIHADPEFRLTDPEYLDFSDAPVVAVTSGLMRRADNPRGGIALILAGDDGYRYYYAHLASTRIEQPTRVEAGDVVGVIGRTGRWARFLEPHLHFSVGTGGRDGLEWRPDVNAAEWIFETFGLPWWYDAPREYPADTAAGSPFGGKHVVTATWDETRRRNPDVGSVELTPETSNGQVPVFSTLTGEVRVHRNPYFGTRVQITNRHTNETVVLSGFVWTLPRPGSVVRRGDFLGNADGAVNYMIFRDDELIDPCQTMRCEP